MVEREVIKAVVLADGRSTIWGGREAMPVATLPVVGKSLLGHKIDELRELGIRNVTVVTDCTQEVGIDLDLLPLYEFNLKVTSAEAWAEEGRVFLTDARYLAEPALAKIIEGSDRTVLQGTDGTILGAWVEGQEVGAISENGLGHLPNKGNVVTSMTSVCTIGNTSELLDINMDVLSKKFDVTRVSGLEIAPSVWLEWVGAARPANVFGSVHIGDEAVIDPTARLSDCVIGRKAVVLGGSVLEGCIVLPGAVVPRGVHLREAIVTDNLVLFADDEPQAMPAANANVKGGSA